MERKIIKFYDKDNNEYVINILGKVYLKVKSARYKKQRFIATWDAETKTLKKDFRQIQIFEKLNAVGFPYYLLQFLVKDNGEIKIVLEYPNKTLTTTLDCRGLKDLPVKYWKKRGYELQAFIPLEKFKKY